MTQIEERINSFVKRIKKEEELKGYTFVKGFSCVDHPNPLLTNMIAVSTLDTQTQCGFIGENVGENLKGSIQNSTVKFRIYAGKDDGGDGLLSLCCVLSDVIKRCDSDNLCEDIKISSISFDEDAHTVYRDVVVTLSFCLYEEVLR